MPGPPQDLPGQIFTFHQFGTPVYNATYEGIPSPPPRGDILYLVMPPLVAPPPPPEATVTLDPPPLYLSGLLHARTDGATTRFDTRSHS